MKPRRSSTAEAVHWSAVHHLAAVLILLKLESAAPTLVMGIALLCCMYLEPGAQFVLYKFMVLSTVTDTTALTTSVLVQLAIELLNALFTTRNKWYWLASFLAGATLLYREHDALNFWTSLLALGLNVADSFTETKFIYEYYDYLKLEVQVKGLIGEFCNVWLVFHTIPSALALYLQGNYTRLFELFMILLNDTSSWPR